MDAVDEGLVNKISFTGSTTVGKIGEICGRNLVSCSLELGGKNPLVVMPSANLENRSRVPTGLDSDNWADALA